MNRIYLIRHAECEANLTPEIISGGSDTPLTPRGRAQSLALRFGLVREGINFDYVFASALFRAQHTARIALPTAKIETSRLLNELHQGDFVGKNRAEVYQIYGEQIKRENWNFRAPNGQSQEDVAQQMKNWLIGYTAFQRSKNHNFAAFSHGLAIKSLLTLIEGRDRVNSWKTPIENTSITELAYDGKFHIVRENDYSHLTV